MDVEEKIHQALEACKKGKWVRNPFAGSFGDTALARIEMADGSHRWEEISMKRPLVQDGAPPTPVA